MATRQDIRTRRRKQRQQQRLTMILMVAGIALIMAAVLMTPTIRAALTPVEEFVQPEIMSLPGPNANALGNPEAPVVFEIYSDFGCGHCGIFAQTSGREIIDKYVASGLVFMRYNSVGSLLGHPNSLTTIEAAYCAGDQNRFWEFHDLIFANQSALFANMNQKLNKTFNAYADSLGLDVEAFDACIKSGKFDDAIKQDYADALQAEISSTPSFLINGNIIIGNKPFEEFQAAIDAELMQVSQ